MSSRICSLIWTASRKVLSYICTYVTFGQDHWFSVPLVKRPASPAPFGMHQGLLVAFDQNRGSPVPLGKDPGSLVPFAMQ